MGKLKISIKRRDSISIIHLDGSLDVDTAPQLKKGFEGEIAHGASIIICNMKNVDYIASIAVGLFIAANSELNKSEGEIRLSETSEKLLKIFEILGFHKVFRIFPNDEKAMKGK